MPLPLPETDHRQLRCRGRWKPYSPKQGHRATAIVKDATAAVQTVSRAVPNDGAVHHHQGTVIVDASAAETDSIVREERKRCSVPRDRAVEQGERGANRVKDTSAS